MDHATGPTVAKRKGTEDADTNEAKKLRPDDANDVIPSSVMTASNSTLQLRPVLADEYVRKVVTGMAVLVFCNVLTHITLLLTQLINSNFMSNKMAQEN